MVSSSRVAVEDSDESASLEDLVRARPDRCDVTAPGIPKTERKRRFAVASLLPKRSTQSSSGGDIKTVCESEGSEHTSLEGSMLAESANLSARRRPGGCLKIVTQGQSLRVHYGRAGHDRSVSWGDITFQNHARVLGDNPACSGVPLSISWKAFETITISIDDYEDHRPVPRKLYQLVVPKRMREDWLRSEGYARGEMREAMAECEGIRKSREANAKPRPTEHVAAIWRRALHKNKPSMTYSKAQLSDSMQKIDFAF